MTTKPKKPEFKTVTERNVTRVLTIEIALPTGDDKLDIIEDFLQHEIRTIGAGEIVENQLVEGTLTDTYKVIKARQNFYTTTKP